MFDEILRSNRVSNRNNYSDTLVTLNDNQFSSPMQYVFFIDENQNKYLLKAPFYLSCKDSDNSLCFMSLGNFNRYLSQENIIDKSIILDHFLSIYNYPVGKDYIICETINDIDLIIKSNNQSILNNLDVLSKEYLKEKVFKNINENEFLCWFHTLGLVKFNYSFTNGNVSFASTLLGGLGVERIPM